MVPISGEHFYVRDSQANWVKKYVPKFWIDRCEVSNKEYHSCVSKGVCSRRDIKSIKWDSLTQGFLPNTKVIRRLLSQSDWPAVGISASNAVKYCRYLGKRLPSWDEWKMAARGSVSSVFPKKPYPWGREPPSSKRAFVMMRGALHPLPVYSPLSISVFGTYNQVGNVSEWVIHPSKKAHPAFFLAVGGAWPTSNNLSLDYMPKKRSLEEAQGKYYIGFRCASSSMLSSTTGKRDLVKNKAAKTKPIGFIKKRRGLKDITLFESKTFLFLDRFSLFLYVVLTAFLVLVFVFILIIRSRKTNPDTFLQTFFAYCAVILAVLAVPLFSKMSLKSSLFLFSVFHFVLIIIVLFIGTRHLQKS